MFRFFLLLFSFFSEGSNCLSRVSAVDRIYRKFRLFHFVWSLSFQGERGGGTEGGGGGADFP